MNPDVENRHSTVSDIVHMIYGMYREGETSNALCRFFQVVTIQRVPAETREFDDWPSIDILPLF